MPALNELVELLLRFLDFFRFCAVIDAYQRGVVLRWGKPHRDVEPGFHWLIPGYVEQLLMHSVATNTSSLGEQTLTTADGRDVVVRMVIRWHVKHVRKYLLDVEDQEDALADMGYGVLGACVLSSSWEEIKTPAFVAKVFAAVRKRGFEFGVEVEDVGFRDLTSTATSHRLWTSPLTAPKPAD